MKLKELIKESEITINESSLSRIWEQAKKFDTGTISAFRSKTNCGEDKLDDDGEILELSTEISKKINRDNNAKLKKQLLGLGYGVTKIKGTYIENFGSDKAVEVDEESFIVVDLKDSGNLKKDLEKLGNMYDQDSITFSKKSGEYYLIGTNKCPNAYPGYKREQKLGKPMFGDKGEFFSKINGRPFVFKESLDKALDVLTNYTPTEIRSLKAIAENLNNIQ